MECGMMFRQTQHLKSHMLNNHEEVLTSGEKQVDEFSCTLCQKKFTLAAYLKNHMVTHNQENPHACTQCRKKFIHAGHLRRHMTNCHNINATEKDETIHFQCPPCQMEFERRDEMEEHMAIHKDILACSRCADTFTNQSHLRRHINIHDLVDSGHAIATY